MVSHINEDGKPQMVEVGNKEITSRFAHAQARIILPKDIKLSFDEGELYTKKGAVFNTAIIAGTYAAKNTSNMIPLCHSISLESINIDIKFDDDDTLIIDSKVKTNAKTGVEMEALVGASVCALTIYDMLKCLSHEIKISEIILKEKRGGKSDFSSNC